MQSGWQKEVKNAFSYIEFLDPTEAHLGDADEYTFWDMEAIKQCDVVFAYLEDSNPGIGLAYELGYALGLNKRVIYIDEKHDDNFDIVFANADVVFDNLKAGMKFLQRLELI